MSSEMKRIDKEHFLKKATQLRSDPAIHYNCAQAVLVTFSELTNIPEEELSRITAHFGSGMRMGATCGAVTGALMALGAAGFEDASVASEFLKTIRSRHDGCLDCRDLLRMNKERGGDQKAHCDGMVYECVEVLADLMNR